MDFKLDETIAILERTPATLRALLAGLSDEWIRATEGPDTWSPYDIVGHLIHGEETDWVARLKMILEHGESQPFEPFDRFAQFEKSAGASLELLLDRFAELRAENIRILEELNLGPEQYDLRGRHPELGSVTLAQLLSTWTAHDLGHIAQITRVMARNYTDAVGPWAQYMPILAR